MTNDKDTKAAGDGVDRNPDPITGAAGSHPVGTGIGTGSGALTGAAIGMVGGPVGAAIGIIAGGIVGAITGHKIGESHDPTEDFSRPGDHTDPAAAATNPKPTAPLTTSGRPVDTSKTTSHKADLDYWKANHKDRSYATKSDNFDADFAPAYQYGTEVSRQNALVGEKDRHKSIDSLDDHLRVGWDRVRRTSKLTYDQAKPAIAEAFKQTLRLHEEQLNVSKRRVETGDVSIRKEIVTESKTIVVPVEREEVVITTRSLSGAAADGASIDDSQTIRVPVSEEQVNVTKSVVATGEVSLDKKVVQDTRTVMDTVRKETAKIDKTGEVKMNEKTGEAQK